MLPNKNKKNLRNLKSVATRGGLIEKNVDIKSLKQRRFGSQVITRRRARLMGDPCTTLLTFEKDSVSPEFWKYLEKLMMSDDLIDKQCQGEVNPDYIKKVAWKRTTVVLIVIKADRIQDESRAHIQMSMNRDNICGFALGHTIYGKLNHVNQTLVPTLYLDILCSANRKGKVLINNIKDYARSVGLVGVYLYAAAEEDVITDAIEKGTMETKTPLLKWYERLGFKRSVYICPLDSPTRSRELDQQETLMLNILRHRGDGFVMTLCL